jgi:nicotinamidase-related amidase
MKTALVIVDIQKDYFPKGKLENVGAVEASLAAKKLLSHFREKKLPVVHIQHISTRSGATYLLPNTEGIDFHENVMPLAGETIIQKHFPNSFRDTQLNDHLVSKEIEELVICGMMSHMCIDTTVRAAFDKGYVCMVAHDACSTRKLVFNGIDVPADHVHTAYMAALNAMFAKVLTAEEIIGKLRSS